MQTTRITAELTRTDTGTALIVDLAGKKISIGLDGKAVASGVLKDWAEAHLKPPTFTRKWLTILWECFLAGTVTVVLIGIIAGVIYLCYANAGSMAEGLGFAIGAGLLGGVVRYFKTTRRAMHKLFAGNLFK